MRTGESHANANCDGNSYAYTDSYPHCYSNSNAYADKDYPDAASASDAAASSVGPILRPASS